jgi:hypothetical protein
LPTPYAFSFSVLRSSFPLLSCVPFRQSSCSCFPCSSGPAPCATKITLPGKKLGITTIIVPDPLHCDPVLKSALAA